MADDFERWLNEYFRADQAEGWYHVPLFLDPVPNGHLYRLICHLARLAHAEEAAGVLGGGGTGGDPGPDKDAAL